MTVTPTYVALSVGTCVWSSGAEVTYPRLQELSERIQLLWSVILQPDLKLLAAESHLKLRDTLPKTSKSAFRFVFAAYSGMKTVYFLFIGIIFKNLDPTLVQSTAPLYGQEPVNTVYENNHGLLRE